MAKHASCATNMGARCLSRESPTTFRKPSGLRRRCGPAAEQLKASLREKESLLKEIHHRVKNNLQVISSLLKLQAASIRDRSALEMFHESQNRIRSMALIHEKLYQSPDLSRVEFASYVRELLSLLLRSYAARPQIELDTAIENAALSIELAVPLGLILNELISNCLKYAFPGGRAGRISG